MSNQDRANLSGLITHPGYSVLLSVMDAICSDSAKHLVWIDPEKETGETVLAAHATARAQNLFRNALINKVAFEIKEWKDELEAKRLGLD